MTTDIIYVNGDSFTYGADIAQHIFYRHEVKYSLAQITDPDFDFSFNKKFLKEIEKTADRDFKQLEEIRKKHIWTTILERILGIRVHNASVCGCGNLNIYHRTVRDIDALKQRKNINVKKIIIQFTEPLRPTYYLKKEEIDKFINSGVYINEASYIHGYYSRSVNAMMQGNELISELEKKYLSVADLSDNEHTSPDSRIINYLSSLQLIKHAIQGATGIKTYFVDSLFLYFTFNSLERLADIFDQSQRDFYTNLIFNDLFPNGKYLGMCNMFDIETKNILGGLHFDESVHKAFAEEVAGRLF